MMETVGAIVIGAGVVGLACARALAARGHEVVVIEAEDALGTQTSARNSEVIHAGIYYPSGSLKARFCVAGKEALYRWCEDRGVPHKRCGKIIVATDAEQIETLGTIANQAVGNGVHDLRWLDPPEIAAMEPALRAVKALWSPSTGIIDSHALMLSLLGDAQEHGTMLAVQSRVNGVRVQDGRFVVRAQSDTDELELQAPIVVNAAGHGAVALAHAACHSLGADQRAAAVNERAHATICATQAFFSKGNYFRLRGRNPFSRLVYPVPEPGGLGIHLTLDLGGQARFGPDVEAVDSFDYPVDPQRGQRFYAAIRRYWPELADDSLDADYAGMRPRIRIHGRDQTDFSMPTLRPSENACLVNLLGIESPGLTSCLAIAEHVVRLSEAA